MLLLPKQRVRRYQVTFIVILTAAFSSMFLIIGLRSTMQNMREVTFSSSEQTDYKTIADSLAINIIEIVSSAIFLIGLLVLVEMLFLWVPSLTDLTGSNGQMVWIRKGIIFPERLLSLLDVETRIVIRRKRSSFRGLFMREFSMEIYISKEKSNVKQITDFTGIEKIINTPTYYILIKTVRIEHLPLQIIQIRSILALMKQSPVKANLSNELI
ncbi:MAG: hypothetical protein JSW11_15695 [Candidatus Heimdallarchaeota archaeon]|nr:MAG: hypothetical protein JSW11_15695 [Candidatus Heimdallarchaeota archaeon]